MLKPAAIFVFEWRDFWVLVGEDNEWIMPQRKNIYQPQCSCFWTDDFLEVHVKTRVVTLFIFNLSKNRNLWKNADQMGLDDKADFYCLHLFNNSI